MNSRTCSAALAAGIPLVLFSHSAIAQDDDLGSLVNKGLLAMNAEKWEEALQHHTDAVNRFGKNNAMTLFGPRFGQIYYRKGICEMKLKKWKEAMQSFEKCHKDFPNAAKEGGGNPFEKMALLRWGEAAMGAEEWELALSQFQKFLKERDKTRDKFPQGTFYVSLAICNYRLGKIPEGNENLEIAIRNKERFPTADAGIVAGFQALVSGVILKRNEQALLDFIEKNRGEIVIDPFAMQDYSRVFMKLAGEAVGADMRRAAFALYQFVPSTDAAIDDVRARLASMGDLKSLKDGTLVLVRSKLEADLKALEEARRGKKANEMVKLGAMAFLHEKNGNVRGAHAAYKQLENYYPASEKREDNLYHLVRTSSLIAPGMETQMYGEEFLKNFPNSQYVPAVRRMLLSALFYDGEYETCIEVAEPMLPKLQPGTQEHDICLHVLGGSFFYTGQYDKAQPLLDQHVEKYPKSLFEIPASYFQASNQSRLQFWSKAASLLDAFLGKYPEPEKNVFLPFALYDRATTHFAEDQHEPALAAISRIVTEFPDSNVIDQAYNLRGNVQQSLTNREEAEKSYLKALEIAERRNNRIIAGESLFSLTALLGEKKAGKEENPRLKEAVPFADRFWKEFADGSPYKVRVAVAQLPAFVAVGRDEEALNRLRDVIVEMAKNPEATGLEQLINSYTDAYLEKHTPEELKEHYYNMPDIRFEDRAARALLRVAIIGVFEDVLKKAGEDEAKARSAAAMIKVLFQELKADFNVKDLTNYILVKVGDYLRTGTSTPRESLPYYDEVLGRQDQSYRFNALLGRADVYGMSQAAADIDKGIADFERVYADSQDKPQREFSLYRIVELLMAKKDYAKAADQARVYLDREKTGFSKQSPKVGLLLAQSFDQRGMNEDALAMYGKVWGAHMGNIAISAPAIKRNMEIAWDRNKPAAGNQPADRQGAYTTGATYIQLTGRFKDKMSDADLELWQEVEKLVKTYEANPDIKSLEDLKKEKEEGNR
jgi:tetratricopeptide (TPR) repeat protein